MATAITSIDTTVWKVYDIDGSGTLDGWKYSDEAGQSDGAYFDGKAALKIYVMYNTKTATPTSLEVRFKVTGTSGYATDACHILYNPKSDSSPGTVYLVKNDGNTSYPYYTEYFTLTKAYNESSFTLAPFWVCDTGYGGFGSTAANCYYYFNEGSKTNDVNYGSRKKYCYRVTTSTSLSISGTVATDVGKGTVSITDYGNNTFTVTAQRGAAGDNNSVVNAELKIYSGTKIDSEDSELLDIINLSTTDQITTDNFIISEQKNYNSGADYPVYVKINTTGEYGDPTIYTSGITFIKNYVAPDPPDIISLTYEKSRLTIKEPWTLSWTSVKGANDSSEVKGYIIRLYRKRPEEQSWTALHMYDTAGNRLTDANGSDVFCVFRNSFYEDTSLKINPTPGVLNPGDAIKFRIESFIQYDASPDKRMVSTGYSETNELVIQNAGIVKVFIKNHGWKEGQVNFWDGSAWQEAEAVKTWTKTGWQESK